MIKIYSTFLFLLISNISANAQLVFLHPDSINNIEYIILEDLGSKYDSISMGGEEDGDADDFFGDVDTSGSRNYFNKVMSSMNSSITVPAEEVYGVWDTYVIHPYDYDLTKKTDTTYIPLEGDDHCGYVHPFLGAVTSNFGKRNPRYHYGIDIKLQTGDTVFNAFEGTVRIARYSPSYGNVVVVRHNNGLETFYAHLSKISTPAGTHLKAGDIIGLGGNTGRSTGSHLHFEVRYKGEPIDPNDIIDFENGIAKASVFALTATHFEYLKDIRSAKYHTVRRGDCLSKIAKRYGTSISRLCKLNKIRTSTMLRAGQKIRYS